MHFLPMRLEEVTEELYSHGIRDFYCGGALGFDLLASLAVLRLRMKHPDVRLLLALPCPEYDGKWKEEDRESYRAVRSLADEVTFVSDAYYRGCMMTRNRYMVNRSRYCISYYDGRERGGTKSTVDYAKKKELSLCNLFLPADLSPLDVRYDSYDSGDDNDEND